MSQHLREMVSLASSRQRSLLSPSTAWILEVPLLGVHLPGVYTPRQVSSELLDMRFPYILHAPNQNRDLEKSTDSCYPYAE